MQVRPKGQGPEFDSLSQSSPDSAQVHREQTTVYYHVQEQPLDEGGTGAKPLCRCILSTHRCPCMIAIQHITEKSSDEVNASPTKMQGTKTAWQVPRTLSGGETKSSGSGRPCGGRGYMHTPTEPEDA